MEPEWAAAVLYDGPARHDEANTAARQQARPATGRQRVYQLRLSADDAPTPNTVLGSRDG
jgi:hypothetical protein